MGTGMIRKVLIAIVVLIVIIIIIYLMFVAVRSGLNLFSTRTIDSGLGINNIINDISHQLRNAPNDLKNLATSVTKGFSR
jgi:cell shape-determining protein MreC